MRVAVDACFPATLPAGEAVCVKLHVLGNLETRRAVGHESECANASASFTVVTPVTPKGVGHFRKLRGGKGIAAKMRAPIEMRPVTPNTDGCEECIEGKQKWVHLRLCLICGHVGCCDSSKNKHATKHFDATGHPVMKSLEAGESWSWCYVDGIFVAGEGRKSEV